jgi:hypothetical protein
MSSKYTPLADYLQHLSATQHEITLSFARIEEILNDQLPRSASTYPAWWAYEQHPKTHVQKIQWQGAGWRVLSVDFQRRLVCFRKIASNR